MLLIGITANKRQRFLIDTADPKGNDLITAAHRLVDVHAHICDSRFDSDRGAVISRADRAGISAIIGVGEDLDDARKNIALSDRYPILKPAAGLYPTYLDPDQATEMAAFIRKNRLHLAAIGEVGLDFWAIKASAQKEIQREIFKQFILLSNELNLPLNVHSRSAGRHAIAMLLDNNAKQVQLHAFDGKIGSAMPAVEAGYFFSIPPSIIRSRQKQKLVKQLPLSCLLVETDSPVLGPDPQSRNEPANLTIPIAAIAQLKSVDERDVLAAIAENTNRLYPNIIR
jgi:TatD DNase family protein